MQNKKNTELPPGCARRQYRHGEGLSKLRGSLPCHAHEHKVQLGLVIKNVKRVFQVFRRPEVVVQGGQYLPARSSYARVLCGRASL